MRAGGSGGKWAEVKAERGNRLKRTFRVFRQDFQLDNQREADKIQEEIIFNVIKRQEEFVLGNRDQGQKREL